MTFIDRLLPFASTEAFYENLITSFWILLLLLIFFSSILYLFFVLYSLRIKIKNDTYKDDNRLKEIWTAYRSSFSNYAGLEKTTEHAEEYFNEVSILYAYMNFRVINNISNILIGFGILGTFVGLTYGIADSKFDTTEEIKISIDNLLSGMGTAFVTSIWGMGLSLLFTIIYKFQQTRVSRKIQNLCFSLDKEFKISQKDLDRVQFEKQKDLINELFNEYLVADTDEGKQMPKNVFRQLLEESVKQTNSLQTFSDDLGGSIELAMEKLVEDNNAQISTLIEEKLIPVLEDLKEIKQDAGTKVIENAVERLADSMRNMMDEFKSSITGDTKQELDGLTKNLLSVSGSLSAIPSTMADMTAQISETIETLKETVIDNIKLSSNEASEQNLKTKELFKEASAEYKNVIEDMQDHMELLLSTQKDNIRQVTDLTDKINVTLKSNSEVNTQFENMIQKSRIVAELIESISKKFENNSVAISDTSALLKETIGAFNTSISEYLTNNNLLMDKSRQISEAYTNRFESIEIGLKSIFDQLQSGLKDYQDTTADGLNKYLKEFSTVMTSAIEGMENNVSGLNEITEELVDQISKMKSNK